VQADPETPPLVWKWRRFSTTDHVITATGAALTLTSAILQPRAQHVRGGLWFDGSVRDALRVSSIRARYNFRDASDVGLSMAVTWPFFIDALFTAWWLRGSRDVAEQMALIDLQTLAVSGAIQGTTNMLVSRERPYGSSCGTRGLPDAAIDCEGSNHYRSFFSGHSSFSFTSAALICVHHFKQELLGPPGDTLSCVGAYAVAATTGAFRIVSDVHYASDVITGALVGSVIGYGVPLLHYAQPGLGVVRQGTTTLQFVPYAGGAGVVGIF
jgi:membrane-associated phospholipid phosphatase